MRPLRSIEASPRPPRARAGVAAAVSLLGGAGRLESVSWRRFASADARSSSRRKPQRAAAYGTGAPGAIVRKEKRRATISQTHASPSRLSSLQIHRLRARAVRQALGALCCRSASRASNPLHTHPAGAFLTPLSPLLVAVVPGRRAATTGAAPAGRLLRFGRSRLHLGRPPVPRRKRKRAGLRHRAI